LSVELFYKEKIGVYGEYCRAVQKKINLIAIGRMLFFLGAAGCGIGYFQQHYTIYLTLGLISLVSFFVVLWIHVQLRNKLLLYRKLLFVNQNEWDICQGIPNQFSDGHSFLSPNGWLDDLDIFGPGSLFHFLNRTATQPGCNRLAGCFIGPSPDPDRIKQYQDAIRVLGKQRDQAQMITAQSLKAEKKVAGLDNLPDWLQTTPTLLSRSWVRIGRWLLPIYTLAALLYWLLTPNYWPLIAGVSANWIFIYPFRKYIRTQHVLIGDKEPQLDQYVSILSAFQSIDPGGSALLGDLKLMAENAIREIRRLSRLSSAFDQGTNNLVNLLMNSLIAYDIQCMLSLEKWKQANGNACLKWISCVGEIESLNSLATFGFNHPDACYPVFANGDLIVEATAIAHPLIPEKERISNDFIIGKDCRIQLITGSNMSGKTTFLRTIGVNLLLAQCGSPVIASKFCFQPLTILCSLRTRDSLQEHSSYFLAELKKLQQIIQTLEKGGPAIVLIDEILKGTNSEDKTKGSGQFLLKLLEYRCLALFATHDLTLSRLEEEFPGRITNYCFESQIKEGELIFDYTLKKGVAKNRNATFLMQKMGIIP